MDDKVREGLEQLPTVDELTRQGMAHWREFRPKMCKGYGKTSELHKAVRAQAEAALAYVAQGIRSGMHWWEAWDLVRGEIFLPDEEEVPELGQEAKPYAEGYLRKGWDEEEEEEQPAPRTRPQPGGNQAATTPSPTAGDPWVQAAAKRSTRPM